ncbi:MAG: sigma-54-dependent Fis family transcriptional regulator [Fibrobacteres bacterium]|nr:sigma-54-dependent Fis family transcriptional regulator [Fibrobacterota bacterium]
MKKTYSIPTELSAYKWLNVLGSSRFIVMLFDAEGRAIWASERGVHQYSNLIDRYFEGPISQFFKMGAIHNLNDAFRDREDLAEIENHVAIMNDEGCSPIFFPSFDSLNSFESKMLCPSFAISQPLTILTLMRVNKERFVGIILLRPISYLITLSQKKNLLITDDAGIVIGYSSLFSSPLKLHDVNKLLGQEIDKVVVFNRKPFADVKNKGRLSSKLLVEWEKGQKDFPFRKVGIADADSYDYFCFSNKLNTDSEDFRLEIAFNGNGQKIPNIIIRGADWKAGGSPDSAGYALTNTIGESGCRFRKNSNNVKYLTLPALKQGSDNTLVIEKSGKQFRFTINGASIGLWHDMTPFSSDSDNHLYLFYRRNEMLDITGFAVEAWEHESDDISPEQISAIYADPSIGKSFTVSVEESTIGQDNCVMYHFEDVTSYVNNIETLKAENIQLAEILGKGDFFAGRSRIITDIKNNVLKIANKSISVLIEGETGTGKEVLARAIHEESDRHGKPFVKIDCSALPVSLAESELFGHEKGDFTGAVGAHMGRFEQAHGGTVFLDEVSNLTLDMQAKLLGVLQDSTICRIGSTKPIKINFRLISASNVPLLNMIEKNMFRSDLYYRLSQFSFRLPPLRERVEDIPLLADHFLQEANLLYDKSHTSISRNALDRLYRHNWPGNVRELRNCILRASVLSTSGVIGEDDLQFELIGNENSANTRAIAVRKRRKRVKEDELQRALSEAEGHVGEAASILGISRAMIYILMKKYNIDPGGFRL